MQENRRERTTAVFFTSELGLDRFSKLGYTEETKLFLTGATGNVGNH